MKIKSPLARCLEKGREPFPIKSVCRVVVDGPPQGWAGGKVSLSVQVSRAGNWWLHVSN